ncbi:MAG: glycoside hydrolase family 28 protein [Acidiferrobacterales bacterium]|nr:glycoside hydrolase family 28 protein [Acidiferrobacterales bacterium]
MKHLIYFLLLLMLSAITNAKVISDPWAQAEHIVQSIEQPNIPKRVFNIIEFGAQQRLNDQAGYRQQPDARPAILAAIDAASSKGGGKVVIPAGNWYSKGPIHLKSRINLHLSQGANLLFSPEPSDYLPAVKTRWEGTELYSYSPLVYAANVTDVAITGKGVLDGNINSQFIPWYQKAKPGYKKLRKMGASGVPVEQRVFLEGAYLRPPLVQFFHANRVLLQDYKSVNSPFWVTHLVYTNHAVVRGIKIDSHIGNNDGVDVESSSYVLIEDSWFRTGDDSVVIKSGRDLDGRTIGIPSTNIVVRNNDMGGEDGIGLGSEMSGGIKDVFFYNNILREGESAFRFKSNLDRGGVVENVYIKDFKVENFKNLFWFQLNYPREGKEKFPSLYKNIVFENIQVKKAKNVLEIHAPKEQPLSNIRFKNITVESYDRLFNVENAEGLGFENFVIAGQRLDGSLSWSQKD